ARLAACPISYGGDYQTPTEMTLEDIQEVIHAFGQAARRANEAGYELLEIHGAHGYLIFEFLSPISNLRQDRYKNGTIFLKEVLEEVVKYWPKEKVLALRVSSYEYVEGGVTPQTISDAINQVKHLGLDLIDVSSGGNILVKINAFPGYQLDLSSEVRKRTGLPTIGGGLITDLKLAEHALGSKRCDLVYLGRALLRDPHLIINDAQLLGVEVPYPTPYIRGKR
ncbi:MAG: hypothetical protein WC992_07790, partial [Acholeplasmataceae bacterium]